MNANQYCNEYIRDAFINGIRSRDIRQRLLENATLTKDEAFQKARGLEMAQKQSTQYGPQMPILVSGVASVTTQREQEESELLAAARPDPMKQKCFYCGLGRHPRTECPARDSVCHICSKNRHWKEMCQSGVPSNARRTPNNHKKV